MIGFRDDAVRMVQAALDEYRAYPRAREALQLRLASAAIDTPEGAYLARLIALAIEVMDAMPGARGRAMSGEGHAL